MIFAIDIGNTNIVIGCIDDGGIVFKERIHTDTEKSIVEFAISMKSILELHEVKPEEIAGGILSSSVPQITAAVKSAAQKILGCDVMEVGPGIKTGLDIRIDNPAQLGADLAVVSVAGIREYGAPLIIADMGTATSLIVINSGKQVIGGMLMPGVGISLESMRMRTAYLPKISLEPPKKMIGSNTVDCMKSGILYGSAAAIDGMAERIFDELGCKAKVVATGGMAKKIIPFCRQEIIVDDELMLKGLKLIYDRNVKA